MPEVMDEKKTLTENPVISQMSLHDHEQILFCNDNQTGLRAIIAVHNTVLGPSLGGTRMWPYKNEMEALNDALRLSRGMTYKSAVAGLNLGGGKAVIIGDSRKDKSEAMFRRFGQFVDSLGGKYITAEDVGINPTDMTYVNMETNHVAGLPGKSGDPSPITALGVYHGMKACAKEAYGSDSLKDKKIAVQGVGHVGEYLVELISKEGAKVFICDIHEDVLKRVAAKYSATVVSPEDIYSIEMDIYAPCALGATINDETLAKLKCQIIAGAANNQLKDEKIHGEIVMKKGLIYAPDYVINAGGIINCYTEVAGKSMQWSMQNAENIYSTILSVLKESKENNIPTYLAANRLAEKRINSIAGIKKWF
jgi:leucine dehydrogenase